MDEKLKYASNHHVCEDCGRRTTKQKEGRWLCIACRDTPDAISNEQRKLNNNRPYNHYHRKHKRSYSDILLADEGHIAGIGDSLKPLEQKLRDITEQTRLKCLQIALNEYKEFHEPTTTQS